MSEENKYRNYDICGLIAAKLASFQWNDSISILKKNTMEFINSFGTKKHSIATLSLHVLHDAIEEKELHELKLNFNMIRKLRKIISMIVNYFINLCNS